jgi:hypothetical protein
MGARQVALKILDAVPAVNRIPKPHQTLAYGLALFHNLYMSGIGFFERFGRSEAEFTAPDNPKGLHG